MEDQDQVIDILAEALYHATRFNWALAEMDIERAMQAVRHLNDAITAARLRHPSANRV